MNAEKINILRIEPNKHPEMISMDNAYDAFIKEIGGPLESLTLSDTAMMLLDEEGKLKENPIGNRRLRGDVLVGTVLIAGVAKDELCSLSEEDKVLYMKTFYEPEQISREEIESSMAMEFMWF